MLRQRFAQFAKEPRILNGDDCLRGKVCDQRDLLVGEGADFLAENAEDAEQLIVFQHWNKQHCPNTAEFSSGSHSRIAVLDVALVRVDIGNMNDRFCCHQAAERIVR